MSFKSELTTIYTAKWFWIILCSAVILIFALPLFNIRQNNSQYKCNSDYDCLDYLDDECYAYSSCAIAVEPEKHVMIFRVRDADMKYIESWKCRNASENSYTHRSILEDAKLYSKKEVLSIRKNCDKINTDDKGGDYPISLSKNDAESICKVMALTKSFRKLGRLPRINEIKTLTYEKPESWFGRFMHKITIKYEKNRTGLCPTYQKNGFCNIATYELTNEDNDDKVGEFRCVFEKINNKD